MSSRFVGLGNFEYLLGAPYCRRAFVTKSIFSTLVTLTEQIGTPLDVYERPETLFAAQFICSPSMNVIKAEGRIEGRIG